LDQNPSKCIRKHHEGIGLAVDSSFNQALCCAGEASPSGERTLVCPRALKVNNHRFAAKPTEENGERS
jgi:hypothetical protein